MTVDDPSQQTCAGCYRHPPSDPDGLRAVGSRAGAVPRRSLPWPYPEFPHSCPFRVDREPVSSPRGSGPPILNAVVLCVFQPRRPCDAMSMRSDHRAGKRQPRPSALSLPRGGQTSPSLSRSSSLSGRRPSPSGGGSQLDDRKARVGGRVAVVQMASHLTPLYRTLLTHQRTSTRPSRLVR